MRLWSFQADMNWDGVVTISDIWLWFKWLYFYPGDGLLHIIISWPSVATFFELSVNDFGGGFSGVISFIVWGSILVALTESDTSTAEEKLAQDERLRELEEEEEARAKGPWYFRNTPWWIFVLVMIGLYGFIGFMAS